VSRRVDLVLGAVCVLFALEAVFLAPLNTDAGYYLRLARAHAAGAVPCRDVRCDYAPLAAVGLSLARGEPTRSILVMQAVVFGCALLAFRLARTLGYDRHTSMRVLLMSWALLLANDGRGVVIEPFALAFLLLAADSFAASGGQGAPFRSGLLVAAAFWVKQYALVGWAGLLGASLVERRSRSGLALSLGVATGLAAGFLILLALGADSASLASMFNTAGYPSRPILENLTAAPELLGLLLLTLAALAGDGLDPVVSPGVRVPLAMCVASLLPFALRGYRHYWHFVIPFLVLLALRPWTKAVSAWVPLARRAAIGLAVLSVGLDTGRVARDIVTHARPAQHAAASRLNAMAGTSTRVLYLVDPALLPLLEAPILAPREVGPNFNRFGRSDSAALLSAADTVVWDTSRPGADELLRRLSANPSAELTRRGFVRTRIDGAVHVYSRRP
jgi:hypothetical protein